MQQLYFFFQAEDGIRDGRVTGVQTCALPIFLNRRPSRDQQIHESNARERDDHAKRDDGNYDGNAAANSHKHLRPYCVLKRSEERRVGKSVDLRGRRIIKKKNKKTTAMRSMKK